MIFTFIIVWPLTKCGLCKEQYKYLKKLLIFDLLLSTVFETYFIIIFVAILILVSHNEDVDHHKKTIMFGCTLLFVCAIIVPLIIIYSAF